MDSLVKQPSLFPILLVNFVGTLGFSIVLPFLVFLVILIFPWYYAGHSQTSIILNIM
jgi:hypothetical protein